MRTDNWNWTESLRQFVEDNMTEAEAADRYCSWCHGAGVVTVKYDRPGPAAGGGLLAFHDGVEPCRCTELAENWDAGVRRILRQVVEDLDKDTKREEALSLAHYSLRYWQALVSATVQRGGEPTPTALRRLDETKRRVEELKHGKSD